MAGNGVLEQEQGQTGLVPDYTIEMAALVLQVEGEWFV